MHPWLSQNDIDKGTRWAQELPAVLAEANFGIICLTPENKSAPWIHYETGALSKLGKDSRVWTYLLDMDRSDVDWPLAQFQSTLANDMADTEKLVHSINKVSAAPIDPTRLKLIFGRWWPDLKMALGRIGALPDSKPEPTKIEKMLEEILALTRDNARQNPGDSMVSPWEQLTPEVTTKSLQSLAGAFGGMSAEHWASIRNEYTERRKLAAEPTETPALKAVENKVVPNSNGPKNPE